MAGGTKSIKKDLNGKPSPQYFNPAVDDYEYLFGRSGANRVELYGPDGNPISTSSGKLAVRASEVETILTALGTTTDAETAGDGTLIAIAKRIRTLLSQVVLAAGTALIGKVQIRNAANNADIDPMAEATFTGRIGEVQASPTANTVLARLKDIRDGVTMAGATRTTATLQNAATANGNGTLMDVSALATAVLEVRGTFSATVNFEGSLDDTNWYPLLTNQRSTGVIATTTPTTGLYEINVSAIKSVRARISGYVSGSVTVAGSGTAHIAPNKAIQLSGGTVIEGTLQNAAVANGNGTNLSVSGLATAVLTVSGTFVATVNFEGSTDGTTFFPHLATKLGDGIIANTTTSTGHYRLNITGLHTVRARISGYASGSVTALGRVTVVTSPSKNVNNQPTGSTLAEQQNEGHAVAGVHTFAANIVALEIRHNETYPQPFWVNGLQIYVRPGGWRSRVGGTPGTAVTALIGFEYEIGRLV